MKQLGLDIGSTTLKYVLLDEENQLLSCKYQRHGAKIGEKLDEILCQFETDYPGEELILTVSGSAGLGLSESLDLPFVQEVFAEKIAAQRFCPGTDVIIELGGEDAKILFLTGGFEMRMNGTCAGGTGAFIDQMASLMQITPLELNDLAAKAQTIPPIASRCGVFAKSDIQPLLNQGARREDVAAGILRAVVNQTVAGLAQGREIKGKLLYLGGPLTFLSELRRSFDEVLNTTGLCPENSLYFVAYGCALANVGQIVSPAVVRERLALRAKTSTYRHQPPLFASKSDYEAFSARHQKNSEGIETLTKPNGPMYLGIDAGSTTVKAVLCDQSGNLFYPTYQPNRGDPVRIIRAYLLDLYHAYPDIQIVGSAVTGYGEKLMQTALSVDHGIVETLAHYTAAKKFRPDVDFIIDIGGQDIKCFQIKNGLIDSLYLNEACSSGCGSFLQTFADTLGLTSAEFAKLGLFADAPADLGSRCTVFMNSSVKQAQKDGASIENIAAGLSVSVVKNALYKVIRCADAQKLGRHIVVQGGTFYNDCVLRAFEMETGREVIRPRFAGLMGAYGAALYAANHPGHGVLSREELERFEHKVNRTVCQGCQNHCNLTVNLFPGGRRFLAGNRCSKPVRTEAAKAPRNLYADKLSLLDNYRQDAPDEGKQTIGIPMGLNFYDLLPFWYAFFHALGFRVLVSPNSTRELYAAGQHTIPSDTACYPAKLLHGHIEWLLSRNPDAIFYPDMSYNVDERLGDDHFNCPVVAYYPQVLKLNIPGLSQTRFLSDFVGLHSKKQFCRRMQEILAQYFAPFSKQQVAEAADAAYAEYEAYHSAVQQKAQEYLAAAKHEHQPVVVLCGRPYHVDPEVSHGIDKLLCDLGAAVITEDSLSPFVEKFRAGVRNQWTYHARMYAAAKYVAEGHQLRRRRGHNGRGASHPGSRRKRLHPAQDRRDHQHGRGIHPSAKPVCDARRKKREEVLTSSCFVHLCQHAEILQQNHKPDADQHDAARQLRLGLILCAEAVADPDACRRKQKRRQTDHRNRRHQRHLPEGKCYADSQSVNRVRNCQWEHDLRRERRIELFDLSHRLADHINADKQQQRKRQPVVDALNRLIKASAHKIADDRHCHLRAAEPETRNDHVPFFELFHGQSLTDGYRERIHRKTDCQHNQFRKIHSFPATLLFDLPAYRQKNRPICPSLQISLVISDATRGNPQPVDRAAQGADYSLIDLHYTKRPRNFQPEFPKRFRSFCPECPNLRALSGRQGSRFRLPSFCTVLHVLCYLFSLIPIVDFS